MITFATTTPGSTRAEHQWTNQPLERTMTSVEILDTTEEPTINVDEPLLSPSRLVRSVRFWVWYNWSEQLDHHRYIPLRQFIVNYRRPYAARDSY